MIVISDSSTLSNFFRLDELEILHLTFGEVLIPQMVFDELLVIKGYDKPVETMLQLDWITVKKVKNAQRCAELMQDVDPGEAEAIALAEEVQADLLLIDDKEGRKLAESLGLEVTGSLGVLIIAKEKHIIPSVKPYIDRLVSEAGAWIGKALVDMALKQAGEKS